LAEDGSKKVGFGIFKLKEFDGVSFYRRRKISSSANGLRDPSQIEPFAEEEN
jgi:hypothetical protein